MNSITLNIVVKAEAGIITDLQITPTITLEFELIDSNNAINDRKRKQPYTDHYDDQPSPKYARR